MRVDAAAPSSFGGAAGGPADSRRLNDGRLIDELKLGDKRHREAVASPAGIDLLAATVRDGATGDTGVESVPRVGIESADLLLLPPMLAPLPPLPKNSRLNDDRLFRTPSTAPDCG